MQGDGDGWSAGPQGKKVWGLHGAAGLMLIAEEPSPAVLLQLRAHWTADGGTWGLPGGARDSHESASEAALRESVEETAIDPTQVATLSEVVTAGPFPADPHRPNLAGNWTYTTVIATTQHCLTTTANEESLELRWVPIDEVSSYALIPPLAKSWDLLRREYEELRQNT